MKTIQDYKKALYNNGKNTMLGLHLSTLINPLSKSLDEMKDLNQSIHYFEEKVEVIVQMYNNGINVFKDTYKLGSVDKAYYQVMLKQHSKFK